MFTFAVECLVSDRTWGFRVIAVRNVGTGVQPVLAGSRRYGHRQLLV